MRVRLEFSSNYALSPGTHTYANGTLVEVTAISNINYTFVYWKLDDLNAGSNNLIEVLMDSNHTIHAVFAPIPYYELTILTIPGGTANPALGTYTYVNGTTVSVTAIPNTGFSFNYWLLDGVKITQNKKKTPNSLNFSSSKIVFS